MRTLIDAAHADAHWALNTNRAILDQLAYELLERETLDEADLKRIFADVQKAPKREVWLTSQDRPVSDIPPVTPPERRDNTGDWRDAIARRAEELKHHEDASQESAEATSQPEQSGPEPSRDEPEQPGPGREEPPYGTEGDR